MTSSTKSTEQCYEVKPGYCLQAYIDNSVHEPVEWVDPSEALTIRSAEEVRREALEEAAEVVKKHLGPNPYCQAEIRALAEHKGGE